MPFRKDSEASVDVPVPEEPDETAWFVFPDSSRCSEAAYNPKTDQLFLRFVRPVPGQVEYVYEDVSSQEWARFKRSASPGAFVNRVLNNHPYYRVR